MTQYNGPRPLVTTQSDLPRPLSHMDAEHKEAHVGPAASCLNMSFIFSPWNIGSPSEEACAKYLGETGDTSWVCARVFAGLMPSTLPGSPQYEAICAWINKLEAYYRSIDMPPFELVHDGVADFLGDPRTALNLADMLEAPQGRFFLPCCVKKHPNNSRQSLVRFDPDRELPDPETAVQQWVYQNMHLFNCTHASMRGVNMHDVGHLATPFKAVAYNIQTGLAPKSRIIFQPGLYAKGVTHAEVAKVITTFLRGAGTFRRDRYTQVMNYCMTDVTKRTEPEVQAMVRTFLESVRGGTGNGNPFLGHSLFPLLRLLRVEAAIHRFLTAEPGVELLPTNTEEAFVKILA